MIILLAAPAAGFKIQGAGFGGQAGRGSALKKAPSQLRKCRKKLFSYTWLYWHFSALRKCFKVKNIAFVQNFLNFSNLWSKSGNLIWKRSQKRFEDLSETIFSDTSRKTRNSKSPIIDSSHISEAAIVGRMDELTYSQSSLLKHRKTQNNRL